MAATNDNCMYSRSRHRIKSSARSKHATHGICTFGGRIDFMGITHFDEVYIQRQTKQKPLYQQIIT